LLFFSKYPSDFDELPQFLFKEAAPIYNLPDLVDKEYPGLSQFLTNWALATCRESQPALFLFHYLNTK
jgi:hypothetical protein